MSTDGKGGRGPVDERQDTGSGNDGNSESVDKRRRALIRAGWSVPVVTAVTGLSSNPAFATSPHSDAHDDVHNDVHGDVPTHTDIPHSDLPHDDIGHFDHDDAISPHIDHFDTHGDGIIPHVDVGHTDVPVPHVDIPFHIDTHVDHVDIPHVDVIPHVDLF